MQEDELILRRVEPPGKQDPAPKGTKCLVVEFGIAKEIYIQVNEDENNPKWEILEEND